MSGREVHTRYLLVRDLGREGFWLSHVVRLRAGDEAATMLLRRLAPEVRVEATAMRAFIEAGTRLSSLDAPNLVKIIEVGVDREGFYLITEYPRHIRLINLIGRLPFPPLQAAMIVHQAACGLTAATFVVHGALSPQRLWITSDAVIKIADCGLHLLFQNGEYRALEATAGWIDPEVTGRKPDAGADCYSLGRILATLLESGIIPNDDRRSGAVTREELLARIPTGLLSIATRCLHPDRSQRFGQAKELLNALNAFLVSEGISNPATELETFLRRQAQGSNSREQPAPETVRSPAESTFLDPSVFWETEREEDAGDRGGDAQSQELSGTQASGLLSLSQGGTRQSSQTEKTRPAMHSGRYLDAFLVRMKWLDGSVIPVWLRMIGGIVVSILVGGALGWFLIGQWTVPSEEPEQHEGGIIKTPHQDKTTTNGLGEINNQSSGNPTSDPKPSQQTHTLSRGNDESSPAQAIATDTQIDTRCRAGCGWIYLTTVPSGATVTLDKIEVPGTTPLLINNVSANDPHVVEIRVPGKPVHKQNVTVNAGDVLNLTVEMH